jgi:membrane-bound metal-dependent hydrolase YbcI (DUF457 family)
MTGKTHLAGGVAATSGLLMALEALGAVPMSMVGVAVACVGGAVASLFPDIDEPNSTISHRLPITSGLYSASRFGRRMTAVSRNEVRDASHRGNTHYLFTWLIVSAISVAAGMALSTAGHGWGLYAAAGVVAGYLSHILLDILSGRIQILAPFSRKYVGVRLFVTGGLMDVFVIRLVLIGLAISLLWELIR